MAIDFVNITDYHRSDAELQEMLLFAIAVAGKKSTQIAPKIEAFLEGRLPNETPFEYITRLEERGWLGGVLREVKISPYGTREAGFRHVATLNPSTVSVEELEQIPGIGPKTSRFFVVHNRRGARHAILDTHILAWLRSLGHDAPPTTPQSPRQYRRLEEAFLEEADRRGLTPAELDLQIWVARSGN